MTAVQIGVEVLDGRLGSGHDADSDEQLVLLAFSGQPAEHASGPAAALDGDLAVLLALRPTPWLVDVLRAAADRLDAMLASPRPPLSPVARADERLAQLVGLPVVVLHETVSSRMAVGSGRASWTLESYTPEDLVLRSVTGARRVIARADVRSVAPR